MACSHLLPGSVVESSIAFVFSDEGCRLSPQLREGRALRKSTQARPLVALHLVNQS